MKKIVVIMLIVVCILTGCNKTPVKETYKDNDFKETELEINDEESETSYPLPEERLLKDFLEKVYTINDPKDYQYELELLFEIDVDVEDRYLGYEDMCTVNGLEDVLGNRLHGYYREPALENNLRLTIDEISYEKTFDNPAEGTVLNEYRTIGYEYNIDLTIIYEDGMTRSITEEGYVNVKDIDGEWKVDLFELKEFKDFWTGISPEKKEHNEQVRANNIIENNVFKNDYLGIKLNLPENCETVLYEELNMPTNIDGSVSSNVLLYAHSDWSGIIMLTETLNEDNDYLDSLKEQLVDTIEQTGENCTIETTETRTVIGGQEAYNINLNQSYDGHESYVEYYFIKYNKSIMVLMIAPNEEIGTDDLEDLLNSIEFY